MDKIVREISDLYELSLSIGGGLDTYANCEQFLSVLLARRNLAYGAIWSAKDKKGVGAQVPGTYHLLCARPACKATQVELLDSHPILKSLRNKGAQAWPVDQAPFPGFLQANKIHKGYIALLRLSDNVFLLLQSTSASVLSDWFLRQLQPVLRKLGVALEGGMAYESLQEETRHRKKAQEEAEVACRARQQFLANVSHEIRTPMNAMLGMVHLLGDTSLDSHQQEYLDVMHMASNNLMELIDNILDASKIEAGEVALDPKPFDLNRLLEGVQQSWQLRVKDKPVQVIYKHDLPTNAAFIGDSDRLQQILNNLLNNANKFTASGTISLAARTLHRSEQTADLRIEISDTGQGIEAKYLPHIFDTFEQGRTAVGQGQAGTGLGLSIVRELLALMKGSISVESKPGTGTTFTIDLTLPLERRRVLASGARHPNQLKGASVLVAEDNLMNQKLVARILDKFGCIAEIVPDGLEAIRCCSHKQYDIILMDIHMPKMDGLEASKRIRVVGKNRETPIVALTAAALLEERNHGLASGMNDFVTKPFTPDFLKHVMLKWLADTGPQVEDDDAPPTEESPAEQVDLSYLYSMSGGDEAFVQDMLGTFLEEIPEMIQSVALYLKAKEASKLYGIVHKFKPNLVMLGLKQQEQACAKIQRMAREDSPDWASLRESCHKLLHVVRSAQGELQRHYSKIPEER